MNTICGVLSRNDVEAPLAAVSAGLHDYGTEGGEWAEEGVGLGFRSRPDAAGGQALRLDMQAGVTCVADVRLDDRETFCATLGVPPTERAALADGDLILRAYLRWGAECPTHLLSDYAFAVWNARTRTLFCARDHIGARPFYYATLAEGFVFASAVEAVLAAPGVSDALDEATVAASLTRIGLTTPVHTFFQAVRKLQSRNEALASLLRRAGICEERGSGIDKVVFQVEFYQLPAPLIEAPQGFTRVVLFAQKTVAEMDKAERVRACYLHACLRYVTREFLTNASLRKRFGIREENRAVVSRYIREAVGTGEIKPYDEHAGKKMMKYVPFWA